LTTIRAALLLLALAAAVPAAAQERQPFRFVYLSRAADPAYEPHQAYTGLVLRDRQRPLSGAQAAVRESRVIGRALGLAFELVEAEAAPEETAPQAIRRLMAEAGAGVFLLDLPLQDVEAAAAELAAEPGLILFNIRHSDDRLRAKACSPVLFHTVPSQTMLSDALAQFLRARNWTEVLALVGPEPADAALAAAFRASADKFGLDIAEERPFVLSNDPRRREENNIALITGGVDYDVIFLADSVGEFGRYVPYASYLPRPVVGSEGLVASAWAWTFERYGAPQLNQRFDRVAERRMAEPDWAAWAAVRAVVEALSRTRQPNPAAIRQFLRSPELTLDLYKGTPGSFRPWDNQLRQPILLATHNAVIALAPLSAFLHAENTLDSLGPDRAESACRMP